MVVYEINEPQSWLFQLANAFLFVSYVLPSTLALRVLLTCGNCCFMLWGWLVLPFSIDTVLWNAFFMIVNFIQTLRILRAMMPVRFDADRAVLYDAWFAKGRPHHIAPGDFKQLTAETPFTPPPPRGRKGSSDGSGSPSHSRRPSLTSKSSTSSACGSGSVTPNQLCFVRDYADGEVVAAVGQRANTLSVILSGRLIVEAARSAETASRGFDPAVQRDKSHWRPVAILRALDFTDSPEWVARATERRPLYSVQMRVDSPGGARIFSWRADALDAFLAENPGVAGVLGGVVGMDLARKVFNANVDKQDLEAELLGGAEANAVSQARLFHQKGPLLEGQVLLGSYSSETETAPAAAAAAAAAAVAVASNVQSHAHPQASLPVMPAPPEPAPSLSPSPTPSAGVPAAAADGNSPFLQQQQALVSLVHLARGTQGQSGVLLAAAGALTHEPSCPINQCCCTCNLSSSSSSRAASAPAASLCAPSSSSSVAEQDGHVHSVTPLAPPSATPTGTSQSPEAAEVELAQLGASRDATAAASPTSHLHVRIHIDERAGQQ